VPSPLVDLFLDAVRVDAESHRERPMADFVRRALAGVPVDVREDDAARQFGGECGNLICVPRAFDPSRPSFALTAHLDTPRSTKEVRPVVHADRITSDGTTALGVDNRAGVSVLLHTLRSGGFTVPGSNALVVFTVGEETGPDGSKFVDLAPYGVRMCFVFDCSKRPGTFIQAAVGCTLYEAAFLGRTSHAGVSPESGLSAIHLAAKALARIPMGRLGPMMTSNVGSIHGGTATNVVPDRCVVEGEVREFDRRPIAEPLRFLEETFRETAEKEGGGLEFSHREDFAPFRLHPDDAIVRLTGEILRSVGLTPNPIDYLGGSDANVLNGRGLPAVNLGIGAQNPHGNDEFILLEDLDKDVEIARAIITRSAELS